MENNKIGKSILSQFYKEYYWNINEIFGPDDFYKFNVFNVHSYLNLPGYITKQP